MGELVPEPAHQSMQEKLMASEAAETSEAAAASAGKTSGEAMKEELAASGVDTRDEDAGEMATLAAGGPGKGELEKEESSMCGLTERAVKAGGDCCVPKSARKTGNAAPEDKESKVEKVEKEGLHNKGP